MGSLAQNLKAPCGTIDSVVLFNSEQLGGGSGGDIRLWYGVLGLLLKSLGRLGGARLSS